MTSAFDLTAFLLVLAAVLAYWNHRVLRLPMSVGLLVSAFSGTLLLLLADAVLPGTGPRFRLLTRGAERPDSEEVTANPRAASARLRAAERIGEAA